MTSVTAGHSRPKRAVRAEAAADLETALARQAAADKVVLFLGLDVSTEAARLVHLRRQLADLDVALLRIERSPQTARRIGKLRQQRAKADDILRGLAEHIIATGCRLGGR